jgi:phenylpropionate dioxygenase-like ring-hydroxylating dioxygenase large terminal subunit
MFQVQERYGLVWVRLADNGPRPLPEMNEWDDPDYVAFCRTASQLEPLPDGRSTVFSM